METNITPQVPPPSINEARGNKTLLIVLAALLVIVLIAGVAWVFYGLGKGRNNNSPLPAAVQKTESAVVTDKAKQPSLITGVVKAAGPDKIVIRQFANFDLSYEIKKEDVAKVKNLEKNAGYDAQKAEAKQKEAMEVLAQAGIDPAKMQSPEGPPQIDDATKKKLEELSAGWKDDPSLQSFLEKEIGWEEIKVGSQVNLSTGAEGEKTLVIYPADFPLGPPTQE